MSRRVVVKIGSNVLTRADGTLDTTRMSALVDQFAAIHRAGIELIVVTSGAVASGRSELGRSVPKLDQVSARQLFSAVGQTKLINRYYDLFREHNIACGQVLTTKESFATRTHYLNQRNCMRVMLDNGVIPIVNENDTISVTELMFTDNDELSGLVTTMLDAATLIILSNIDGIFNGNPTDPKSQVIRHVVSNKDDLSAYIQTGGSTFGRGGMLTKSRIASTLANEGVEVIIANGKRDNIVTDLVLGDGEKEVLCTRFEPTTHAISGVKRWIAHSEGFAKGELHINAGALKALTASRATSLLPVGVCRVVGDFAKDDIVRIVAPDGTTIGVGKIAVDAIKAAAQMGKHGAKPFVHYDYLYLE
ncbi:MAG: glutamate 5-kinase [Alistipes sp.]